MFEKITPLSKFKSDMKLKLSVTYIISCLFLPLVIMAADGIYTHFQKTLDLQMPDTSLEKTTQLRISFSADEWMRQSRQDTLMNSFSTVATEIYFRYAGSYSVSEIDYCFTDSKFIFNKDDQALNLAPDPNYHKLSVRFEAEMEKWKIRPEYIYRYSHTSDLMQVNRFPESQNDIENDYFFHLLPQTFGDSIPYSFTDRSLSAGFNISRELADRSLFFEFKHDHGDMLIIEAHENNSEHSNLQGSRESNINADYLRWSLKLGQKKQSSACGIGFHLDVLPLTWIQTVFPIREDSIALDMIDLTDGQISDWGALVFYDLSDNVRHFSGSVFAGQLRANAQIATPVLGYTFFSLPIAHRLNGEAGALYTGFELSLSQDWQLGIFNITPSLDVLFLHLDGDIRANAQLQFGLSDIDYEEDILANACLGNIGMNGSIFLSNSLRMTAVVSQLIPYMNIISPEIIVEEDDIEYYGGLMIKFSLDYLLK